MRVLIFLLISTTAHLLAARWLLAVSPWARARRRRVFLVAGVLSVILAVFRIVGYWLHGPRYFELFAFAMIETTIVLISLLPLGAIALASSMVAKAFDAVRPPANEAAAASRVSRREAVQRIAGVSAASVTTLALGWGMKRGRHAFALEEVPIVVRGWPRALDGYIIAQVSDIHVGAFVGDRALDEGFELVQRIKPDLVIATGDLVDNDASLIHPLIARLVRASARDGACAILGNHDHYAGPAAVAEAIRRSPVRLLDNTGVRMRPNDGGGFALLGVDDLQGFKIPSLGYSGPDLDRAIASVPSDIPRILLAHQPRFFDDAHGRVALQLSGHTHGGQINPGFRPARVFMQYIAGRYDRGGSSLYVNRGFGVTGPPVRIGAPPEVTKIVLVSG